MNLSTLFGMFLRPAWRLLAVSLTTIGFLNAHPKTVYAQPSFSLSTMDRETVGLVKKVESSVVTVIVQRKHTSTANGQTITDYERQIGSGIVWNKDGFILTTADVVREADELLVSFPDGQYRPGVLVGVDPLSDIAIVRVDSVSVLPARIGDSDIIAPGSWVFLLSHAQGLPATMSFGLVNGIRQEDVLLQVSAVLSANLAGGAVFSSNGRLIGIVADSNGFQHPPRGVTGLTNGSGTIAVIPINRIKTFANHLVEYGEIRRSWLGVYVEKIWDSVAVSGNIKIVVGASEGMGVTYVYPDSPAEQAGLKVGDRLLAVNGIPMNHPIILAEFVTTMPAGAEIEVRYLRSGQEFATHSRLSAMPHAQDKSEIPGRASPVEPDAVSSLFNNPEQFRDWIEEREQEIQDHLIELARLKQLWQNRAQPANAPSRP